MSLHAGGGGADIEYAGKAYKARPLTRALLGEYEALLGARARKALQVIKDCLTEEQYLARADKIARDYEDGEYSFYSRRGLEFLNTNAGRIALGCLIFGGIPSDEMFELAAHRKDEVEHTLTTVVRECMERWAPGADGKNA